MGAAAKLESPADPMATVRALNRMRAAGFALRARDGKLVVTPAENLSDAQRAYLRSHKPVLVALLEDAETVYRALVQAGTAGLGWREGTPADWSADRLLVAGEVLYADGHMVNRHDRRYCPASAPPIEIGPECHPPDCDAPRASCAAVALMEGKP